MGEWKTIDSAPKDGTRIRIRPRYGLPEMNGAWAEYEGGRAGFAFVAGYNVDPTHWMPLPPPPGRAHSPLTAQLEEDRG